MTAGWGWVLVGFGFLAILFYDGRLVSRKQVSMSRWLMEATINRPWVPFVAGLLVGGLAGHLFWPLESCLEALK